MKRPSAVVLPESAATVAPHASTPSEGEVYRAERGGPAAEPTADDAARTAGSKSKPDAAAAEKTRASKPKRRRRRQR